MGISHTTSHRQSMVHSNPNDWGWLLSTRTRGGNGGDTLPIFLLEATESILPINDFSYILKLTETHIKVHCNVQLWRKNINNRERDGVGVGEINLPVCKESDSSCSMSSIDNPKKLGCVVDIINSTGSIYMFFTYTDICVYIENKALYNVHV